MINIENFQSKLPKIGYITIKEFGDCANIHNADPLYLLVHSATGY